METGVVKISSALECKASSMTACVRAVEFERLTALIIESMYQRGRRMGSAERSRMTNRSVRGQTSHPRWELGRCLQYDPLV